MSGIKTPAEFETAIRGQYTNRADVVSFVIQNYSDVYNRLKAVEQDLKACQELLAILNSDGGHRQAEVGIPKAAKEAEEKWYNTLEKLDIATYVCESVGDLLEAIADEKGKGKREYSIVRERLTLLKGKNE